MVGKQYFSSEGVSALDLPAHVNFDGECLCHYVLHEAQHCLS